MISKFKEMDELPSDKQLRMETTKRAESDRPDSILEVEPAVPAHENGPNGTVKSLFAFTRRRNLRLFIPGICCSIAGGVLKPLMAVFLGLIFDVIAKYQGGQITETQLMEEVSKWCLVIVGIGLGNWLMNGGSFVIWVSFGEAQARNVRTRMFKGLLRREMKWFDLCPDGISSLLVRVQTQIRELQLSTSQPLGFVMDDIASVIGGLGVAFYFSWKLTLVLLCILPVGGLGFWLMSRRLQPAVEKQKVELGIATKYANTAINAVDTVKVFNGQEHEVDQYTKAIAVAAESYFTQANSASQMVGFGKFLVISTFVVGFWYGLALYNEGEMTAGNVLTTLYAFLMASQAAQGMLTQMLVLTKGMSAGESIKQLMGDIHSRDEHQSKTELGCTWPQGCDGDVEIKDINFAYPSNPQQMVLRNCSFSFPVGETTFLFGRSGSGKSTISNLLLKFYEQNSGEITIDGHDIRRLDTIWVRENITLVQQDSVLFNGTIEENLNFGSQNGVVPSKEAVDQACDLAMLTPVIHDLPLGIKTPINASTHTMSGGQKQRVAIARARLRDTPILILDEVTSALDIANKDLVWEAIRYWRRGKTTIIVTHDQHQIRDEDFVYIMKQGEIVEEGFRKMLMKNPSGVFATLVNDEGLNVKSELSPVSEDKGNFCFSPLTMDKKIAPSIVGSVTSYDTAAENTDAIRPNTTVATNLKRFSQFLVQQPSRPMSNAQAHRRSMGLGYANAMAMEDLMRRPPPQRSVKFAASTVQPPEEFEFLMRPWMAQQSNTDENRRSLRPLSVYDAAAIQGLPSGEDVATEYPRRMIRRASVNFKDPQRKRTKKLGQRRKHDEESGTSFGLKTLGRSLSKRRKPKAAKEGDATTLKEIFSTVWPNLTASGRVVLIFAFIFAILNSACTPTFSFILAKLLNTFYVPKEQQNSEALKWATISLGIAVLDGLTGYGQYCCFEWVGRLWVDELRVQALRNVLGQPREWFDDEENTPAKLSQVLDRSAEEMKNLLGRFVGFSVVCAGMVSISVIWAFVICWKLTLVGLAITPALYGLTRAFDAVSSAWEKKTDVQFKIIGTTLTETFANIRVVRALTLEQHFENKHQAALEEGYRIGLKRGLFSGILHGLSDSTTQFSGALFFYYGAVLISTSTWAFSDVVAATNLLLFGLGSATSCLAFLPQISQSRVTATQILDLANLCPFPSEISNAKSSPDGVVYKEVASPLPIKMSKLNFAYPLRPGIQVLRSLSLVFQPNEYVALVGSSGSGKSTMAALLLGLYAPSSSSDTITFGHKPLAELNLPALRSHMALVPQFPVIFPRTVAENITYGLNPETHPGLLLQANMEAAARAAGLHEFISSLPLGYSSLVGEGGQGLSGGQQMRLAIARALVRKPKVLVLDEPTAGLDVEAADVVCEALRRAVAGGGGVAVVVITHDLRIMKSADKVVVLDKGAVVEEGAYNNLRWRGGPLTKLVGGGEVG